MTALLLTLATLQTGSPRPDPIVREIDLNQVEWTVALETAFKAAGGKLSDHKVAKDVEGKVTLVLKNIPLETVLRVVTVQVDALFELRDGKYMFFHKDRTPSNAAITLSADRVSTGHGFKLLFGLASVPYRIDATSFRHQQVNLDFDNVKLEYALDRMVRDQGMRYRVEKGTYIVY